MQWLFITIRKDAKWLPGFRKNLTLFFLAFLHNALLGEIIDVLLFGVYLGGI
jgi:hypothetical protein